MAVNDDYLIDTLMDMGAVDVAQVEAARPAAEAANAGLVDTLIVQKVLNPDRIVHARAMQFGSEVVDLREVKPKDDLLRLCLAILHVDTRWCQWNLMALH